MEGCNNTHAVCADKLQTPTSALRPTKHSPKPQAKSLAQVDDEGDDKVSVEDPNDWVLRKSSLTRKTTR